jgi:hypothetical protein
MLSYSTAALQDAINFAITSGSAKSVKLVLFTGYDSPVVHILTQQHALHCYACRTPSTLRSPVAVPRA